MRTAAPGPQPLTAREHAAVAAVLAYGRAYPGDWFTLAAVWPSRLLRGRLASRIASARRKAAWPASLAWRCSVRATIYRVVPSSEEAP